MSAPRQSALERYETRRGLLEVFEAKLQSSAFQNSSQKNEFEKVMAAAKKSFMEYKKALEEEGALEKKSYHSAEQICNERFLAMHELAKEIELKHTQKEAETFSQTVKAAEAKWSKIFQEKMEEFLEQDARRLTANSTTQPSDIAMKSKTDSALREDYMRFVNKHESMRVEAALMSHMIKYENHRGRDEKGKVEFSGTFYTSSKDKHSQELYEKISSQLKANMTLPKILAFKQFLDLELKPPKEEKNKKNSPELYKTMKAMRDEIATDMHRYLENAYKRELNRLIQERFLTLDTRAGKYFEKLNQIKAVQNQIQTIEARLRNFTAPDESDDSNALDLLDPASFDEHNQLLGVLDSLTAEEKNLNAQKKDIEKKLTSGELNRINKLMALPNVMERMSLLGTWKQQDSGTKDSPSTQWFHELDANTSKKLGVTTEPAPSAAALHPFFPPAGSSGTTSQPNTQRPAPTPRSNSGKA